MSKFHTGDIVAIADVPEDLAGKVVQGQPVTVVQTFVGNDTEVLVAGLNRKEYPIAVENLCSIEESCEARAARWFLCDIVTHRESLAAYEQVVLEISLDGLEVWHMFEDYTVHILRDMMRDLAMSLMYPYKP